MSSFNLKDAGAFLKAVGGGKATGVAAGTGDNTAATGAIVDMEAHEQLRSGCIAVFGSATLAATKVLDINDVQILTSDDSGMSGAVNLADGGLIEDFAAVVTGGSGGTTEFVSLKKNVNLEGAKRYVQVSIKPDLNATGTDTFSLGFGLLLVGDSAPLTYG